MIGNQFGDGDPFGYIDGNNLVLLGPENNYVFLANSEGVITNARMNVSSTTEEEIIAQVQETYPAVNAITYEIGSFSVGDEVNISEII